jgi:large subunit ribosomal protein L30
MATLKITQVRSTNGANPRQRDTLRSLGLGKIGRTTEREDGDVLRGMVAKVAHMVKVDG